MSRKFLLTPSASRDLDQILEYVLTNSGANRARIVHSRLRDAFGKLASRPGMGHIRDDLDDESLRVYVVFSYLIIYLPDTRPLQVIRVIHGARDLPSALDNPP